MAHTMIPNRPIGPQLLNYVRWAHIRSRSGRLEPFGGPGAGVT